MTANIFRIQNNSWMITRLGSNCIYIVVVFFASLSSGVSWPRFPFHCLFSSFHFSLTTFCISSLQFILSDALFLHSSPSLSTSLLSNSPSQFQSSLPFPLHFLSICSLCQFFISHTFRMTSPFKTTPCQFLLKICSFTPTSTLSYRLVL